MDASLNLFLYSAYAALVAGFVWVIWSLHRSPETFDAKGMFCDGESGKVSLSKIGQLVSLLTTTWVIFYMTVHDKLSTEMLGVYMATWAVSRAVTTITASKNGTDNTPS